MGLMTLFQLRSRLFGSVFAVAAVTVGVIAIASAGPATRSASAQPADMRAWHDGDDDRWSSLRYRQHHRYRCQ